MIVYKGDISKNDANVLKEVAEQHTAILEFGVGASTQILSAYSKGQVTTVDTSSEWINRTKRNIEQLGITNVPKYYRYEHFLSEAPFDLIFVDGLFNLRKIFALRTWRNLKVGGILAFHDTRRQKDINNVCEFINLFYTEIETVECNYKDSNITIIKKKDKAEYVNWQISEK